LSPLGIPWTWPETHDHAKWGITVDSDWVCVGDINRMVSQEKRGGGTIALQDPTLWAALSKTDLLVAPPGHTRVEARALIKETHKTIHERLPTAVKSKPAKKKAARKSTAKKKPARKAPARKHTSAKKKTKRR
jgi:hypothetical protein